MHAPATTDEAARLRAGLATLGLDLDDTAQRRCQAYLDLLERWNRSYNLTAVRERPRMLAAHILDSLAVVSYLRAPRCLDMKMLSYAGHMENRGAGQIQMETSDAERKKKRRDSAERSAQKQKGMGGSHPSDRQRQARPKCNNANSERATHRSGDRKTV